MDFFHILLYYSLNLKWIKFRFLAYTQHPIMSKWNYVSRSFYKCILIEKLKCLESKYSTPLLWQAKISSGVNICLTIHMISHMDSLCTPHIQWSVRSLSRAVNFKHRFNHKEHGGFPMPHKDLPIGRWVKNRHWISLWAWSYSLHYGWCINTTCH